MSHGNRIARRRRYHVDLLIRFGKAFFQNDHGKYRGSGGNVSCALLHTVGSHHSRSGVAFRRTHGNSGLKFSCWIEELRARLRQCACVLSCHHNFRQDIAQLPGESVRLHQFVELLHHFLIVILRAAVNGEHTGSVADSLDASSGELPVDIRLQRCDIVDIFYMLFFVQDSLIKMGDTPSLGNIVMEKLHQFLRRLPGNIVSPCTERNHQLPCLIKRHISVHHGADAESSQACQFYAVKLSDIVSHGFVAALKAFVDILQAVGPYPVLITVLPLIISRRDRIVRSVYQDRLDPGGTEFNTQRCFPVQNCFSRFTYTHGKSSRSLSSYFL